MYSFYSGNKKGTGSAMSVGLDLGKKEDFFSSASVFLSFISQVGYNENTNRPVFKGGKTVNIKLSVQEAVGLTSALSKRNEPFTFFHKFNNDSTSGRVSYYKFEGQDGKRGNSGFSFAVKKNNDEWKASINENDGMYLLMGLTAFLKKHIEQKNESIYAKKGNSNSSNSKNSNFTSSNRNSVANEYLSTDSDGSAGDEDEGYTNSELESMWQND